mmetsp:Transcript_49579/g.117971  ORF Transcript_49579/g.117971 Transcript_49579/m.117971 type:complete len:221 (-) Transcript_49579:285-947(-)
MLRTKAVMFSCEACSCTRTESTAMSTSWRFLPCMPAKHASPTGCRTGTISPCIDRVVSGMVLRRRKTPRRVCISVAGPAPFSTARGVSQRGDANRASIATLLFPSSCSAANWPWKGSTRLSLVTSLMSSGTTLSWCATSSDSRHVPFPSAPTYPGKDILRSVCSSAGRNPDGKERRDVPSPFSMSSTVCGPQPALGAAAPENCPGWRRTRVANTTDCFFR